MTRCPSCFGAFDISSPPLDDESTGSMRACSRRSCAPPSRSTGNPLWSTSRVREVPPPRCSNHLLIGLGAVGLNAVALQGVAPHDLKLLLLVYPCELLFHNRYRVGPIPVVVRKVTGPQDLVDTDHVAHLYPAGIVDEPPPVEVQNDLAALAW